MANLKKTLRIDLTRGKFNVLDLKASLKAAQEALQDLQAAETITDEERATLNAALDQFLADNAEPSFETPNVVQIVSLKYLDVPMKHIQTTQAKLRSVIRENLDKFWSRKGKGGGLHIVSRLNDEGKKAYVQYREELAKQEAAEAQADAAEAS